MSIFIDIIIYKMIQSHRIKNMKKVVFKMDKKVKIIIALHKNYEVPKNEMYLPLHVGAEGKEDLGFEKDNTGNNISSKNPFYSELTGLYWAYKNLKADYVGLVHYRRYFQGKEKFLVNGKVKKILSTSEVSKLLDETDIILPKKRNYYIETLYSHYAHTMYVEPLDITGEIIKEKYPDYYAEFENLKKRKSAHMFNMFVMKKEIFNEYSKWLFDILFELEKRVDNSKYDSFHARFYGRISELLLDIFLRTKNLKFKEVKLENIEKQNFFKRVKSFLRAKFKGEKYGKSF